MGSESQAALNEEFDGDSQNPIDWWLVLAVFLLTLLGILNVHSASGQDFWISSFKEMTITHKQIVWVCFGYFLIIFTLFIDYRLIDRIAYFLYGLNIIALLLVKVIGVSRLGAKRWIELGFFNFQPSEFMKITLVMALARYFQNLKSRREAMGVPALIVPVLIIALPTLLIMSQPDLGTGGHLAMIGAIVLLFVGIKKRVLLGIFLMAFVSFPLVWQYGLKDYQKDRIRTFMDPMRDPRGKGFNAIQAMIAVGSGRLSGKGYQKGTQTQYDFTPEEHTDFIFTVLSEEWGFLGVLLLFLLYVWMLQRCLAIASIAKDRFAALLAVGMVALFITQIFINVSMVCGLFPIVGIPLPLLSYGGTSMLTSCLAVGLILGIGYRKNIF